MKARKLPLLVLLICGCILDEQSSTVYLEADGSVLWSTTSLLVRSDHGELAKREEEEKGYLAQAWAGKGDAAELMRKAGAYGVETHVTRDRRPYGVTTEGHFSSIDALMKALFEAGPLQDTDPGKVDVTREGPVTRLHLVMPAPKDGKSHGARDWRFVVAHGRFLEATGFTLSDDGMIATWHDVAPIGDTVTYDLAWTSVELDQAPAETPEAAVLK